MDPNKKKLVFLADDDGDDREFFESVCSEVHNDLLCKTFTDGTFLLEYLKVPENELPDIVFLDINMPKKDGLECLEEIRKMERLEKLCVIMYSTSSSLGDIKKSYELGANGFVQKPHSYGGLREILKNIFDTDWDDPCNVLDELNFVLKPKNEYS